MTFLGPPGAGDGPKMWPRRPAFERRNIVQLLLEPAIQTWEQKSKEKQKRKNKKEGTQEKQKQKKEPHTHIYIYIYMIF